MGMLATEIRELRDLIKDYDAGKAKRQDVLTKIAIYSQIERRFKLFLQAIRDRKKYGESVYSKVIDETLLIGHEPATTEKGEERPKKLITRNPCLECEFKDEDKNRPECVECNDRLDYLMFLDGQ